MKILVVAGVHGDEINAVDALKHVNKTVDVAIANQEAVKRKVRFIDRDLNRAFPGNLELDHEAKIAYGIRKVLSGYDVVIDLHTTTADTESFVITTERQALDLARCVPLSKVVIIPSFDSLISYCRKGISIEFNERLDPFSIAKTVNEAINNVREEKRHDMEVFEVTGKIHDDGDYVNFRKVDDFYPVLYGEKSYKFYGFKAKKK